MTTQRKLFKGGTTNTQGVSILLPHLSILTIEIISKEIEEDNHNQVEIMAIVPSVKEEELAGTQQQQSSSMPSMWKNRTRSIGLLAHYFD